MKKRKLIQLCALAVCFLMVALAAYQRDRRVLGHSFSPTGQEAAAETVNGCINTTEMGADVIGYAGPTPLEVCVEKGRITAITPLPNVETPSFFERCAEPVLSQFVGKPLAEAASMEADVVSGATYSSNALIANVRLAAQSALAQIEPEKAIAQGQGAGAAQEVAAFHVSWKWLSALLVAAMGALLPLWHKGRRYRRLQLLLNVGVLGFWSGTFLSYAQLVGMAAGGVTLTTALLPLLLVVVAFLYPVFGRPGHYCVWICPFGSLQELAGMTTKRKLRLSPAVVKWLTRLRKALWFVLMLFLWTGASFAWMDYEPFVAFFFQSAPWFVVAFALAFLLLSFFVTRPYCRFVCPTGTLMKCAEARSFGTEK